jgi:tight adherence protein B
VLPVIVTFLGVFAIILGSYLAFVVRPEVRAQRGLERHLQPEERAKTAKGLAVPASELSQAPIPWLGNLQATVDQSGMKLTVPALLFLCWLVGFFVGLALFATIGRLDVAIVAGGLALFLPYLWVRRTAKVRMWKFEEQFPEAIDLIARALRAGHALPTGLQMVADELPPPVGPEFKLLYDRQNFGMPLADALRAFAHRVPVLDARFFVTALLTQRETGGDLSGILDGLAAVIRQRFKVKRQIRVVSAHGRITAAVLMAVPPAVGFAQTIIAPANIKVLTSDALGIKMLVGAVVLQLLGMIIISRIIKVEY